MTKHETPKRLHFQFEWKASLLAVVLFPCMISLGYWQLDRADEKQQLKTLFEQRKTQQSVNISTLSRDQDLRYKQVHLRGMYMNDKVLLLDNKIYQGRFGYEVINAFQLVNNGSIIMVNRGWVAGDKSRRSYPILDPVEGEVEISGEIYVPPGSLLSLGDQYDKGWPRVVQSLDFKNLSEEFDSEVFPYSIRLNNDMPGSYLSNWVVVSVQPEKHTAYAFQWFAMAATLVIIMFLANTNFWTLIKQQD